MLAAAKTLVQPSASPFPAEDIFSGVAGAIIFIAAVVLAVLWIVIPLIVYMQWGTQRTILKEIRELHNTLKSRQGESATQARVQPPEVSQPKAEPVEITCPTCTHQFGGIVGESTTCPRCQQHIAWK